MNQSADPLEGRERARIENAEREQFHAVAKRLGWSTERFDDGTYMSVGADDGWQLWQEARAGLAELFDCWDTFHHCLPDGDYRGLGQMRAAIKSVSAPPVHKGDS